MVTALGGSLGPHSPPGGRSSSGYRSEALRGQGCAQGHTAASPRCPSVPSPHRYATPTADPCLRLSKLTGQGFRWVQGERRRLLEASFAQTPPAWAPTFPRAFAGWGWGCGLSSPPLLKRCLSVLTSCCHPDKSRGGGGVLTSAGNNGRKLGTENHPIQNLPHTFQTPARLNEQHGAHDADPRSPWMCRPAERAGAGSTFDICGSGLESLAKERFFLTIVRNMNYPESLL